MRRPQSLARGFRTIVVAACLFVFLASGSALAQQTFTVNASSSFTTDVGDENPGDGTCATSSGVCSFIAAIEEANADADKDRIEFGSGFNPTSSQDHNFLFPDNTISIVNPVVIDGRTAPQYEQGVRLGVTLYSQAGGTNAPGIIVESSGAGTEIYGLAVVNYTGDGFVVRADDVVIADCYASVIDDAISSQPNGGAGIRVESGSNVVIGRNGLLGAPNVLADNGGDGIVVEGGSGVRVGGNLVGLLPDGTSAARNGGVGIRVTGGTSHQIGTLVQSTLLGDTYSGNVVSSHVDETGILIAANGIDLYANVVGLTADESDTRSNLRGIVIQGDNNTVGPASGRGAGSNVVAGNDGNGITVGYDGTAGNDNVIQHNYAGVSRDMTLLAGNNVGIGVFDGQDNDLIGNVVGANAGGISVASGVFRTILTDNYVGTNPDGDDLGNLKDGISVFSSQSSGTSTATRISGGNVVGFTRTGPGIRLQGRYNSVGASYVGTNADGADLGNGEAGILIEGDDDSIIGDASNPNVIGFNDGPGIEIIDATSVTIQGNYIGTDASTRNLGNVGAGIRIEETSSGTASDILIGYDYGSTIPDEAQPADGNVIQSNGGDGIEILGAGTPLRITMRGNTTFGNSGRAIDLNGDGIDGTDDGDADGGANNTINAPQISDNTVYNTSTGQIDAQFKVTCATTNCDYGSSGLTVDFYATTLTDEAGRYVGTVQYPSSSVGSFVTASFTPPSDANVQPSDYIVGVTTSARGNSSELPEEVFRLPVELADFRADADGKTAVLTWRTLNETGNDRFVVEHQTPQSEAFTAIGDVDGAGTTSETTRYRFTTEALDPGTHRFRLRQIDVDGDETLSKSTVTRIELGAGLVLEAPAPNPVQRRLSVKIGTQSGNETTRLVVYDLLGRAVATVYEGRPTPGELTTVDTTLPPLPSGRYFLRLESGSRTAVQSMTIVR